MLITLAWQALLPHPSHGFEPTLEQIIFDGAGLDDNSDVAISPDGAHIYTHGADDCIGVFARDETTGEMSFRQVRCNSESTVDGLVNGFSNAGGLTVSPDGSHLYVASGDGLVTFQRDAATGEIAGEALLREGDGGAMGIVEPEDVLVSPDGDFVYTADRTGAVAVFARDDLTGQLSFVEAHFDNMAGVDGIGKARGLALSPGAEHLYVVSGVNAADEHSLAVFERHAGTGALTFVQAIFDNLAGADGLEGASDVEVSPDGRHVYVTADRDDAVAVFARDGGSGTLTFVQALFDGMGGINRLDDPRGIAIRSDGSIIAVTAQTADTVLVFARESMAGTLTLVEEGTNGTLGATGLRDPIAVIYDPGGEHTYIAARDLSGPGGVVALASAPGTGVHSFVEDVNDDNAGIFSLGSMQGVTISSDGRFLYVIGDGEAVTVFSRDTSTGLLSLVEIIDNSAPGASNLIGPIALTLSPDGAHLYVSADDNPSLIIFERDAATGQLTFAFEMTPDDSNPLNDLTISADGLFLYASGDSTSAVQVYGRDPVSGALSFLQTLEDGVDAEGIGGSRAVVLAPGDGQLYVVGENDDAIARFSRDPATGLLSFVDAVVDGMGGVSGLDRILDLSISGDGTHLYAVANNSHAVTLFTRDPGNGALTFVESLVDGAAGITGLDRANTVQVSADGAFVLVGSAGNDPVLAVFLRDAVDGRLRFASRTQTLDSNNNEVQAILLSPDDAHAYLLHNSPTPDAVAVFGLPRLLFSDGFESGDTTRWSTVVP